MPAAKATKVKRGSEHGVRAMIVVYISGGSRALINKEPKLERFVSTKVCPGVFEVSRCSQIYI